MPLRVSRFRRVGRVALSGAPSSMMAAALANP